MTRLCSLVLAIFFTGQLRIAFGWQTLAPNSSQRPATSLFGEGSSTERRDFLKGTVAAGLVTSANLVLPSTGLAESRSLAKPIQLPKIGLGAWSWGDSLFWGYDPKNDNELEQLFDYAIQNTNGPLFLDTAELYGIGRSEELIGKFSKKYPDEKTVVATKFAAYPFRTKPEQVVKACEASVKRLGGRPIDLYQIHFPNSWNNAEYWDGMAQCYEKGLIKSVGVSNYGVDAMKACASALEKRGIPLSTNQIQLNLLYKYPEENGLLQACKDMGVKVLSYSPMALGLLTGKYTDTTNLPEKGPRKKLFAQTVTQPAFQTLLTTMKEVAAAHGEETTVAQVAINWTRAKGTIPIPGARNSRQIKSNLAALKWDMSEAELRALDKAAAGLSYITPDASPFPREDINTKLKMFDS